MSRIVWQEEYSVGVSRLDEQHKRLVAIINRLEDAVEEGEEKGEMVKVLDSLAGYIRTHFTDEERLMSEYGYPGTEEHQKEHVRLAGKVADIYRDYFRGNLPLSAEVMDFLNSWLAEHIAGSDRKYAAFFRRQGLS